MLNPEQEKTLQELFSRLDEKELFAVYGLATHLDELAADKAQRCTADAELEVSKGEQLICPERAGYHYGEATGTIKAGASAVNILGQFMSSPTNLSN